MRSARCRTAFTLVEIMIAIALVVILSAIAVPRVIAYRKVSHAKACRENMETIRTACYGYLVQTGKLTTDFDILTDHNSGKGFLKRKPRCPVGGTYTLTVDQQTQLYTITCSMADDDEHNVSE